MSQYSVPVLGIIKFKPVRIDFINRIYILIFSAKRFFFNVRCRFKMLYPVKIQDRAHTRRQEAYLLSDYSVVAPAQRLSGRVARAVGTSFHLPEECSAKEEDDAGKQSKAKQLLFY